MTSSGFVIVVLPALAIAAAETAQHYLSRYMSLQSGDVIFTGTPPGVGLGQKPPVYLRAGQQVRLGINGLGEQQQRVV